jgi:hypothetical protein
VPTRLLIVANRLPLTLTGDAVRKSSGGLVAALEGVSKDDYDVRWVGWPGGDVPADRWAAVRKQLDEQADATPVFLSADEVTGYYHGCPRGSRSRAPGGTPTAPSTIASPTSSCTRSATTRPPWCGSTITS